jgi:hypothetical protein
MNLKNVKVPKMPGVGPASALLRLGIVGGIGLYAVSNSLYNVEGGHRAIVFNRIDGVKDQVNALEIYTQIRLDFLKIVLTCQLDIWY